MEEIENTVGIDTDWTADGRRVGSVTTGGVDNSANRRRAHVASFFFVVCKVMCG